MATSQARQTDTIMSDQDFKMLLAQSGFDEDGGVAPLKLVNLEDPESRRLYGLDS